MANNCQNYKNLNVFAQYNFPKKAELFFFLTKISLGRCLVIRKFVAYARFNIIRHAIIA